MCLVGVWQRNFEPVGCVYCPASWELLKLMVLKYLVKECRVHIFKQDDSGHKHNENSNDSGGGGGSIQCSLYHMDVLWRHKIISVCQLQQC